MIITSECNIWFDSVNTVETSDCIASTNTCVVLNFDAADEEWYPFQNRLSQMLHCIWYISVIIMAACWIFRISDVSLIDIVHILGVRCWFVNVYYYCVFSNTKFSTTKSKKVKNRINIGYFPAQMAKIDPSLPFHL